MYNSYMNKQTNLLAGNFATPEQARIALEFTGYILGKMDGVVYSQQQEVYFADLKKIIETWPKNSVSVI